MTIDKLKNHEKYFILSNGNLLFHCDPEDVDPVSCSYGIASKSTQINVKVEFKYGKYVIVPYSNVIPLQPSLIEVQTTPDISEVLTIKGIHNTLFPKTPLEWAWHIKEAFDRDGIRKDLIKEYQVTLAESIMYWHSHIESEKGYNVTEIFPGMKIIPTFKYGYISYSIDSHVTTMSMYPEYEHPISWADSNKDLPEARMIYYWGDKVNIN